MEPIWFSSKNNSSNNEQSSRIKSFYILHFESRIRLFCWSDLKFNEVFKISNPRNPYFNTLFANFLSSGRFQSWSYVRPLLCEEKYIGFKLLSEINSATLETYNSMSKFPFFDVLSFRSYGCHSFEIGFKWLTEMNSAILEVCETISTLHILKFWASAPPWVRQF